MVAEVKRMDFVVLTQPLGNRHPVSGGTQQAVQDHKRRASALTIDIAGKGDRSISQLASKPPIAAVIKAGLGVRQRPRQP